MFSLIVTLIAVALVVILAATAIYFGSNAWQQGAAKANAAKLVAESQQLVGAINLYRTEHEGQAPSSMSNLTDNGTYLSAVPLTFQWVGNFDYFQTEGNAIDADTCLAFNRAMGVPVIPLCNEPAYQNMLICCSS